MTYSLVIPTLDRWPTVEITRDEFEVIKRAKTKLGIALGIEEKFGLLVENYAEYERTLLDLTLANMIRQDRQWTGFMDNIQLVNRRIANVLTASQLYIDQTKHDISSMFGRKSAAALDLQKAFVTEAQQSLEYRVMRELRNHAQHRTLPVGSLAYPGSHQTDGKSGVRFGVQVQLDVESLRDAPRFDPVVRAEIEAHEAARDLTAVIRKALESFSRVHELVREITERDVGGWAIELDKVLETARTQIGHVTGLAAIEQEDDGTFRDEVHVFPDFSNRVREMRSRYKNLKVCSGWYVSSGLA